MTDGKIEKLLHACEIVKKQDERETELMTLAARCMQAGYELGRAEAAQDERSA